MEQKELINIMTLALDPGLPFVRKNSNCILFFLHKFDCVQWGVHFVKPCNIDKL